MAHENEVRSSLVVGSSSNLALQEVAAEDKGMAGGWPVPDWPQPKALADPLRILGLVFLSAAGAGLLAAVFVALVALNSGIPQESRDRLFFLAASCFSQALIGLALFLLVRPHRTTNAFFLRAFSTDAETTRLRRRLTAVLGKDFRLSGIRPPPRRSSVFTRFCFGTWTALRYAGSTYMDLEAGENWLARLMTSCADARIAFIDVRKLTPQVQAEVLLSWKQLGAGRCLFIVDDSMPEETWRERLCQMLTVPSEQSARIQLGAAVGEGSAAFFDWVRGKVDALPEASAGFTLEAIKLVQQQVPREQWVKGWETKDVAKAAAGAVMAAAISWVVAPGMAASGKLPDMRWLALPYGIAIWVLFFVAVGRSLGEAAYRRRWGKKGTWGLVLRPVFVTLLALASMGSLVGGTVPTFVHIRTRVKVISATNTARQLDGSLQLFILEKKRLPTADEGLGALQEYLKGGVPLDPWGRSWYYRPSPDGKSYSVGSCGPDGVPDTEDDIVVEGN
jgi:general secretion pathway protein G